jgi:hypothetical protein
MKAGFPKILTMLLFIGIILSILAIVYFLFFKKGYLSEKQQQSSKVPSLTSISLHGLIHKDNPYPKKSYEGFQDSLSYEIPALANHMFITYKPSEEDTIYDNYEENEILLEKALQAGEADPTTGILNIPDNDTPNFGDLDGFDPNTGIPWDSDNLGLSMNSSIWGGPVSNYVSMALFQKVYEANVVNDDNNMMLSDTGVAIYQSPFFGTAYEGDTTGLIHRQLGDQFLQAGVQYLVSGNTQESLKLYGDMYKSVTGKQIAGINNIPKFNISKTVFGTKLTNIVKKPMRVFSKAMSSMSKALRPIKTISRQVTKTLMTKLPRLVPKFARVLVRVAVKLIQMLARMITMALTRLTILLNIEAIVCGLLGILFTPIGLGPTVFAYCIILMSMQTTIMIICISLSIILAVTLDPSAECQGGYGSSCHIIPKEADWVIGIIPVIGDIMNLIYPYLCWDDRNKRAMPKDENLTPPPAFYQNVALTTYWISNRPVPNEDVDDLIYPQATCDTAEIPHEYKKVPTEPGQYLEWTCGSVTAKQVAAATGQIFNGNICNGGKDSYDGRRYVDFSKEEMLKRMAQFYYDQARLHPIITTGENGNKLVTYEMIHTVYAVCASSLYTGDILCDILQITYDPVTNGEYSQTITKFHDRRFYCYPFKRGTDVDGDGLLQIDACTFQDGTAPIVYSTGASIVNYPKSAGGSCLDSFNVYPAITTTTGGDSGKYKSAGLMVLGAAATLGLGMYGGNIKSGIKSAFKKSKNFPSKTTSNAIAGTTTARPGSVAASIGINPGARSPSVPVKKPFTPKGSSALALGAMAGTTVLGSVPVGSSGRTFTSVYGGTTGNNNVTLEDGTVIDYGRPVFTDITGSQYTPGIGWNATTRIVYDAGYQISGEFCASKEVLRDTINIYHKENPTVRIKRVTDIQARGIRGTKRQACYYEWEETYYDANNITYGMSVQYKTMFRKYEVINKKTGVYQASVPTSGKVVLDMKTYSGDGKINDSINYKQKRIHYVPVSIPHTIIKEQMVPDASMPVVQTKYYDDKDVLITQNIGEYNYKLSDKSVRIPTLFITKTFASKNPGNTLSIVDERNGNIYLEIQDNAVQIVNLRSNNSGMTMPTYTDTDLLDGILLTSERKYPIAGEFIPPLPAALVETTLGGITNSIRCQEPEQLKRTIDGFNSAADTSRKILRVLRAYTYNDSMCDLEVEMERDGAVPSTKVMQKESVRVIMKADTTTATPNQYYLYSSDVAQQLINSGTSIQGTTPYFSDLSGVPSTGLTYYNSFVNSVRNTFNTVLTNILRSDPVTTISGEVLNVKKAVDNIYISVSDNIRFTSCSTNISSKTANKPLFQDPIFLQKVADQFSQDTSSSVAIFVMNNIFAAGIATSDGNFGTVDVYFTYKKYTITSIFSGIQVNQQAETNTGVALIYRFTVRSNKTSTCDPSDYYIVPGTLLDVTQISSIPSRPSCQIEGGGWSPTFTILDGATSSNMNSNDPTILKNVKLAYEAKNTATTRNIMKTIVQSFSPNSSIHEYKFTKDKTVTISGLNTPQTFSNVTSYLRVYLDSSNAVTRLDEYGPDISPESTVKDIADSLRGTYTDGSVDSNGTLIVKQIPYIAGYDISNPAHTTNTKVKTNVCTFGGTAAAPTVTCV